MPRALQLASQAFSQLLRLGAGLLVFVILARVLGPAQFGLFSVALALAIMATIVVNFGFTTYALREIGARQDDAHDVLADVFCAKVLLSTVAGLLGLAVMVWQRQAPWPFACLFVAQIAESFTELYTVAFRVRNHAAQEAKTSSWTSGLHIALMGLAGWQWAGQLLPCAVVFMLSRVIGMSVTRWRARESFPFVEGMDWAGGLQAVRSAWSYALEIALNTAASQLDAVIINLVTGSSGLGVYQAGMKLVQGATRIAPIVAQVLLPTLSANRNDPPAFRRVAWRTLFAFGGTGLVLGLPLVAMPGPLTRWLFGAAYVALPTLLPVFGLILFLKFVETGSGLVLVALGLQSSKVWLVAVQLLLLNVSGYVLLLRIGVTGWQWALVLTTSALLAFYLALLHLQGMMGHKPTDTQKM